MANYGDPCCWLWDSNVITNVLMVFYILHNMAIEYEQDKVLELIIK
jgi:hypothetical protein